MFVFKCTIDVRGGSRYSKGGAWDDNDDDFVN